MAEPKSTFLDSKTFDDLVAAPLIVSHSFAVARIPIREMRPIIETTFE